MSEKLEFVILAKDQFSKSFGKLTKHLPSIKTLALGAAGGATALGASLIAITKSTATAHDELGKFANKMGVSTEWLSKMDVAAEFAGVEANKMRDAFKDATIKLGEASLGSQDAMAAFNALGVEIYKNNGELKTMEEITPDLADGFKNVQNATEKVTIANKIFGGSGLDVVQMLQDGSIALKESTDAADKFGVTVSEKAAAQAALFNDALFKMQLMLKGARNIIAEQVMPVLTGMANKFSDFAVDNRAQIIQFSKDAIKAIGEFVEKGAYGVAILVDSFRGLQMTWNVIKIGFAEMSKVLWESLDWLAQKLQSFLKATNFRGMYDEHIAAIEAFSGTAQENIDAMTNMSQNAYDSLNAIVEQGTATDKVEEYTQFIKDTIIELDEAGRVQIDTEVEREEQRNLNLMANLKIRQDANIAAAKKAKLLLDQQLKDKEQYDIDYEAARKEAWSAIQQVKQEHLDWSEAADKEAEDERKERDEAAISQARIAGDKLLSVVKDQGKAGFQAWKTLASAKAMVNAYEAASTAYKALSFFQPAAIVAAGIAWAFGLKQVQGINKQKYAAHGGMTTVPKEQTMLLDEGERILSPKQNQDLTAYLESGGSGIENVNIAVMPNVTNPDALLRMSRSEWDNIVETNIIPSLRRLKTAGVMA